MSNNQLILLYLVGFVASIYVGMRIEAWRWSKRSADDISRAYDRGYKAGRDFHERIAKQKTDLASSVRILTGEEGYDA